MKVPLHFGEDILELEIPQENLAGFLQPAESRNHVVSADVLASAVNLSQAGFTDQVRGCAVGLLLPDGTRDLLLGSILSLLMPLLLDAKRVLFFICTGSHDSETPSNIKIGNMIQSQVSLAGITEYEIISHDCQKDSVLRAGTTRQGTEVLYNSRLQEVDMFVVLSDVKHHYFAGYSNPIKNIVPGLCGFKTIEQNHSLTFNAQSRAGIHPWHPNISRRDNPLAADQLEAMLSIVRDRPVWALTVISHSGTVQWADFGLAADVCSRAFQQADDWNMRKVKSVDYMVISPGGLPHDVDLYIAQRALELTTSVLRDGGEILFLAACPGGIGIERTREHFEDGLMKPLETILKQAREEYHLFDHKPYRFARLIQRLDKLWIYTQMTSEIVRKTHMKPCIAPQTIISSWLAEEPDAKILVVDGANKLLLTVDA